MPTFGETSTIRLKSCDERLQKIFAEVIKHHDCTVLCGHRGQLEQDEAFRTGMSKLKYPNSKHNSTPSKAVDVVPFPIDWKDFNRFYFFAGFVFSVAANLGIKIRWGGDFNNDGNFKNDGFMDLPHFELVD